MSPHEQACAIAREFLERKTSLVDTCRRIQPVLHRIGVREHNDFSAFIGVDSEADDFPLGSERERWNKDVLAKKDAEFAVFEQFYTPSVEIACRAVLTRFAARRS